VSPVVHESGPPPFQKILVANRGEIAVRVLRACRELGVRTVAIFSEADRGALHVRHADEAYCCGPAVARESYLNIEGVLRIAKECGAEAIHPGYGFLSENAEFARACATAGIVFIGPSPETILSMGDKVTARTVMAQAGVPIVPGTTQTLTDAEASEQALAMGLPVMVKATAGGGGKGMRLVREESALLPSIRRARSEAGTSFGNDAIYIEKFVEEPRHIEIQVMGDSHGNVIHLFEREDLPGHILYPTVAPARPFTGTVAISPTLLVGLYPPPGMALVYPEFLKRKPDDRAGVFFIYNLP